MRLTIVDEKAVRTFIAGEAALGATEQIADLLRAEVSARGQYTRSAAVKRVVQGLAPAFRVEAETVSEVCADLERAGDFQDASGGVLFATPIRGINLGTGEWQVVASMPVAWLRAKLPGSWKCQGIIRRCRVEAEDQEAWKASVAANGGVLISPEVWAGFARTPLANADWLAALDARLQNYPEPAGSLERESPISWSGLTCLEDGVRWRNSAVVPQARLWRARNQWGYWLYTWTHEGPPSAVPFHQLRSDEGARAVFALAALQANPIPVSIENRADNSIVSCDQWLPAAEYRFVSVSANESRRDGIRSQWSIPRSRAVDVVETLRQRLGISIRESLSA